MNPVIIFDLNYMLFMPAVKAKMKDLGYSIYWSSEGKVYNLPDNVVWKISKGQQDAGDNAIVDLREAINKVNSEKGYTDKGSRIELERCIVLNAVPWRAIEGISLNK